MYIPYGYVRVGTAVPAVTVADVTANVEGMLTLARQAASAGCDIVAFPELGITAYSCADLFQQRTLIQAAEHGLARFAEETAALGQVFIVGLPVRVDARLFNCAAVINRGRLLGIVPKTFLPNYREFYEKRWFTSATASRNCDIRICGQQVAFGNNLLFRAANAPDLAIGVEICEDLWAPIPPSSRLALAGASLLINISASDDLVGKADYRRALVKQQSARCLAAYAYCSAGVTESTTDLVFGGHCLVAENGTMLAESSRFRREPQLTVADVDIDFLQHERTQNSPFCDDIFAYSCECVQSEVRDIHFEAATAAEAPATLRRPLLAMPFVPADDSRRQEVCEEIFAIQSNGLATRMEHTQLHNLVIGLSGGLDSTLALLVAVEACNRLQISHDHIYGLTMPGFGTSDRTRDNVNDLCRRLGVKLQTINIHDSCEQHFRDLGHDGKTHDVTFENVQARERTQLLMDKANMIGGLVVGTGDLSELALGWCTYNGDHMSMYAVNTGVPKTLVSYLVRYVADTWHDPKVAATLNDILDTPISPELLPTHANGDIAQRTEDMVGPYELHDFYLYHFVRCGFMPAKALWLAQIAFAGKYDGQTCEKWLNLFIRRFFASQFKRSCLPDGPKVGTIALSPRGDWRMPSDASPAEWLRHFD